MNTILSLCLALFLFFDPGIDLEIEKSAARAPSSESILIRPIYFPGQQLESPLEPSSDRLVPSGPRQVVKVLYDRETNRVMLVGSKEDIAIVKRAIESFNKKLNARPNPIVMEKVRLKFQLAETVAAILSNSMASESNRLTNLKFDPIHFPESILLVGPKDSVERAKRLIESVDSHPGFLSKH